MKRSEAKFPRRETSEKDGQTEIPSAAVKLQPWADHATGIIALSVDSQSSGYFGGRATNMPMSCHLN